VTLTIKQAYAKLGKEMKLRATTTVQKRLRRGVLIAMCFVLLAAGVTSTTLFSRKTYADQYDDQINALQSQIDSYNAQASQLAQQAQTLQRAVDELNAQIGVLQAQIDLSQAKHDKLVAQIADTETQIQNNKDALGQVLADLYVNSQVTPIEMLASSKNISDYLDKQAFRSSMQDQLTSTIDQIQKLETQLKQEKVDVDRTLGDQKNAQGALDAKRAEQQNLVAQTQGEESRYQQLASDAQAQQAQVRAQQQAYLASLYNRGGGARLIAGGAAPDYPWNRSNCPMGGELGYGGNLVYYSFGGADGSGGDGHSYGCRQCASYVAWRVARETGYYPENWGNATNFPESAQSVGYRVGYAPRAGSIGVIRGTGAAPEGHVAWVESVNGDGSLTVSQYNYNYNYPSPTGWGLYSEMVVPASSYNIYVYIK
jgi:surface antigen/peptidoglycan hydrolase CwlO-like protein